MQNRTKIFDSVKDKVKLISPRIRVLERATEIAEVVLSKEEKYANMSMKDLRNLSYRMSDEIKNGSPIDNYLIDALAIARETIWRVHKQKAYKVQIIGAIVAHFGDFAEMKTGEGKTLSLLLVSYVNALSKKGVHIVTVNEYLVERDKNYSEAALGELGITVGYILSSMKPEQKKKMYACDITYVSNSELGFDYLRDNMVSSINEKMQRGLNFAIVDEADSVLIDESRTPLIIAANPEEGVGMYIEVDKFVKSLEPNDYVIDLESHAINLNDNGIKKTEEHFKIKNLYDIENSEIVHKLMNALRANFIMESGKEYIVKLNKSKGIKEIALVDSFTGRVMEGRMYSAGLHQAIQAKEGVEIEPENVTVATITYQSFFRLYSKLAGVSGTALTEKNEFLNIYNMVVVNIPTNKPVIRVDQPDYIFASKQAKWKYVVAEIKRRHSKGQPILVGTVSVEDSELLHRLLDHIKIPHNVLNAKNDNIEAEIIKKAGIKGAVTIATNMAGRGTDIKLGDGVLELGGLYVLGTERNESRRIDNQLRGRSGRQGDPGESRFFISLQDSLFKRFASDKFDKAQYKLGEDVIDLKFFSRLLDRTQKRVENLNFDIRKNLIDYDYVLSEQRELIYKQRDLILQTNDMLSVVKKMVPRVIDILISINRDQENTSMIDYDNFFNDVKNKIGVEINIDKSKLKDLQNAQIYNYTCNQIMKILDKKYNEANLEQINNEWRVITISSIDKNWTKFLDKIQKLRDGVALRSYEQKSPLNIYVEDSDRLFYNITINIAEEVLSSVLSSSQLKTTDSYEKSTDLKFMDGDSIVLDSSQLTPTKKSIDDLEVSKPLEDLEKIEEKVKEVVDEVLREDIDKNQDDPINDEIKDTTMSDNKTSRLEDNVTSVVDEILSNSSTPNVSSQPKPQTPPPPPPPPPMTQASVSNAPKQENNDFLKQVLDVVDKDIETKPMDFSGLDEMIKEENKASSVSSPDVSSQPKPQTPPPPPPPPPIPKPQTAPAPESKPFPSPNITNTPSPQQFPSAGNLNNNIPKAPLFSSKQFPSPSNLTSSMAKPQPFGPQQQNINLNKPMFNSEIVDHNNDSNLVNNKFLRESSIAPETYNHNIRIDRKGPLEIEKVQKELDAKHIEIINEKYNTIIGIKDENIKSLIDKSISLETKLEEERIEFGKQIEEIYSTQNEQLKLIKQQLEGFLEDKKRMEKLVHEYQVKELQAEQQKIADQRDALEQERLKLEEEKKRLEELEGQREEVLKEQQRIHERRVNPYGRVLNSINSVRRPSPSIINSNKNGRVSIYDAAKRPQQVQNRPSIAKVRDFNRNNY